MTVIKRFGLRHIRHFTAVAETLHFRRAAETLGIAQPALSRSVQHLERELGVTLFERDNRNVKLTDAGRVFLEGSTSVLDTMNATILRIQKVQQGEVGSLNIGYTDFAIGGDLPSILASFRKARTDVAVNPMHAVTTRQLQQLAHGDLDIGFVTGPVTAHDLVSLEIQRDTFVAVVPDTHALAQRKSISLQDLAHDSFVVGSYQDWRHFHLHLDTICDRAGIKPNVVQEAYNTDGILGLVACGMGVTILTERIMRHPRPGLTVLQLPDVTQNLSTLAVYSAHTKNKCVQMFVDHLSGVSHEISKMLN
ncbi:LysR family transcriptional regulator [Parasulfitobacter algicola]|uniref:LysR family transcriptional regulator n=1 Tax=Parasulfitobacter algicola TaxID=2614809 RepID=A0ABX2J0W2_9RHOB|nr:LysR family transcriptional regulator [Sulfitobacter algicola]NSX56856.1 LysR family transcriptional regulator [Sulfitobacter algicola]